MRYDGLAEDEAVKVKKLEDFLDNNPKQALIDYF